MDTTDEINYGY